MLCNVPTIETHEVLVIRIYFLSTSNPQTALIIFSVPQEKQKGKYVNFLRKKSQDCYVRQILETGLEPCNLRWRIASILFDRFQRKSLTTVRTLPRAYRGREFTRMRARERSDWQRGLILDCSGRGVICGIICVLARRLKHIAQWARVRAV